MDRFVGMILRRFMRQIVNKGIGMGIDKAAQVSGSRSGKKQDGEAIRRTRQSARMLKRITRI